MVPNVQLEEDNTWQGTLLQEHYIFTRVSGNYKNPSLLTGIGLEKVQNLDSPDNFNEETFCCASIYRESVGCTLKTQSNKFAGI